MSEIPSALTEREAVDLDLHVRICAERYNALESRMTIVEHKVNDLVVTIEKSNGSMIKALIATGGTIVVSILSLIAVIVTKSPIH